MYFIESTSIAASSLHNWLNLCSEKTVEVILAKSWQKSLNITYQSTRSTLNQPFISQASNTLW